MTDTTKTEALRLAKWACARIDPTDIGRKIAAELRRLSAERDRLAAELSFINDTAREYFAKQGMAETLDAKHPALIVRQMASEILRQRKECDRLAAECEALRAALSKALLWTDEEFDVADWRSDANAAMGGKESQGGNGSGLEGRS